MAQIILTIPNDKLTEVIDAICLADGYGLDIPIGFENPETKTQFARRVIKEEVLKKIRSALRKQREAAYIATIESDVTNFNITIS